MPDPSVLVVPIPEFVPGVVLVSLGYNSPSADGLTVAKLAAAQMISGELVSPSHWALEELLDRCPELYQHPPVASRLKELGHPTLTVLAGLEERKDRWRGPGYSSLIGAFHSLPSCPRVCMSDRGDEYLSNCWILLASPQAAFISGLRPFST